MPSPRSGLIVLLIFAAGFLLMYWMNPSSDSGIEFAALANRMSGMAVAGPPSMSSTVR